MKFIFLLTELLFYSALVIINDFDFTKLLLISNNINEWIFSDNFTK